MVSFLTTFAAAALSFACARAAPLDGLSQRARDILGRAAPAAPRFVVYGDTTATPSAGPPAVDEIKGFDVYAMSFLLLAGAWDKAYEWTSLTADERTTIKSEYADAGIKLIVAVFGATDVPTTTGADPVATAQNISSWVKEYGLDGVDVDYEDFGAFDKGDGSGENWLIDFTTQLRSDLPAGDYIITHAPVAPWFSPSKWGGGGYLAVNEKVGDLIDWYNIQFYNQGTTEYTTCDSLLNTSSSTWPESALFEIIANGVDADKLVIGKPATSGDANNGYIAPETLAECLQTAKAAGWSAGAMSWQTSVMEELTDFL
ncbi:glycoside hydrolase family 18 protein [Schizophyllum commune H4-8]|uniref:chitinase n=1 Tax=Schizophyllum commune (strain H4-8 / FGSC 9210) TaxID=578458 RepID=D8Q1H7_SCHCM|nr:glycoside hydrolase family 18 protein [Schizophyllum commune H4-8]KAI5895428.1 glycoside hydrolase family 18 protein [Schizophyllum commune H4-8]